jgi:phospholipase/carboxylesterase
LHGLGADGNDLIGLAPMLAQAFPDALFLAPNAPQHCDMAPYGFQWFSLQDRAPSVMLSGARATSPLLDAYLNVVQKKYGLDDSKTALIGFSQGTMMSLFTGLRRAQPLAGIVGFSGMLVGVEVLSTEIKSRPPVCLIHGSADDVVPHAAMSMANAALKTANVEVETHTRPGLGHGIDPEGINLAIQFLRPRLS